MRVSIVAIGKAKSLSPDLRAYQARAGRYWSLDVVEVRQSRGKAAAMVMRAEAAAIKARLRSGFVRVAVTRGGDRFSSPELARWLRGLAEGPAPGVHFSSGEPSGSTVNSGTHATSACRFPR